MPEYRLLSDAILDGARLTGQARNRLVDRQGRTCALGAAIHACVGEVTQDTFALWANFTNILNFKDTCPVADCSLYAGEFGFGAPLAELITHLNDDHQWSREQIAGFVATVEERLGLVEIISDESTQGQHSSHSVAESAPLSLVGESVSVSS